MGGFGSEFERDTREYSCVGRYVLSSCEEWLCYVLSPFHELELPGQSSVLLPESRNPRSFLHYQSNHSLIFV